MEIEKVIGASGEILFALTGRMDTTTAPKLEAEALTGCIDGAKKVIVDMTNLEYISSAGLRVLLAMHKKVSASGIMVITNANEMITEVFDVTGFADILNIE